MSKDFRSDRIRTSAIIGTGSVSWSKPHLGLLFYSSSQTTSFAGEISPALTTKMNTIGTDVWMAVDGDRNNSAVLGSARTAGSSVLFLGDVVVSGTLWAERSVVTVTDSVLGDFRAPNKIIQGFTTSPETGTALFLADPTTPNGSVSPPNGPGAIAFKTTAGNSGDFSIDTTDYHDVFFHVSGSRGVKGSNDRGLALFSGDVHLSGNLSLDPLASITAPGPATIGGDVTIGNDLFVTNDLTVTGDDIKGSSGTAITFDGVDTTLVGDLKVGGNDIKSSDDTVAITLSTGDVTVWNDLTVNGNDIKSSTGAVAITLSTGSVTVAGDLTVLGNGINDASGAAVIYLSGSGDASFNKNVTILGDLNVSGSTVSIGVDNLRVEDPVILMGSGSTTTNSNGGIAIASGSRLPTQALTFGRGGNADTWRAGRKDVLDGEVTTLADAEPVLIEASGLSFPSAGSGASLMITGSTAGPLTHMTMSNDDGDITFNASQKINLTSAANVYVPAGQRVYLGTSNNIYGDASSLRLEHTIGSTVEIGDSSNTISNVEFAAGSGNKIRSIKKLSASSWRGVMQISGTHFTSIYADGGVTGAESNPSVTLILSASSDDTHGGPIIVLSSSAEYSGAANREGFIILGSRDNNLFTMSRHRDVRTLLSGGVGTAGTNTRGVTLATGDLVVSGNTKIIGTADIGVLNLDNLSLTADPDPYIQFNNSTYKVFKDGDNLKFQDNITGPVTLADLNSLSVVDNTDVFTILGGEPSYIKTTGSFSFDTSNRHTTALGSDVYFFVSGSELNDAERGKAVFGGDVHISGTLDIKSPKFYVSMNTAYRTPNVVGGVLESGLSQGAGAIINTMGLDIPIQVKGAWNDSVVLGLSGSLDFVTGSNGDNSRVNRIKMVSDEPFAFHNSNGEVFRMLGGSQGQHALFDGSNQLQFEDSTRYIHGLTETLIKKVKIHNNSSGGHVVISTTGAGEGLVVTGSITPGADTTYDLGSPAKRWANVYTGDLHLKNDRGNWTIYEEPDMLVVVNNMTGKKYKMGLTPLEDEE